MNIKWIIIGVIGFVLFIMMGNNPFEAPKGYVREDPVKKSLQDRASGKSAPPNLWSGPTGGSSGYSAPSNNTFQFPGTPRPNTAPAPVVAPAAPKQPANPLQPTPFQNLPTQAPTAAPPPGATLLVPSYVPTITLASGEPIRFVGSYVFTQDEKGNVVRMKDGQYTTAGGVKIIVEDGRNMWQPIKWENRRKAKPGAALALPRVA